MAEEKKGTDFPLQSTGVLALALAVLGLIWAGPSPLIDERPASHAKADKQQGRNQDIPARLWQDPLGAVAGASKESAGEITGAVQSGRGKLTVTLRASNESDAHYPRLANPGETVGKVLMLGVMISGGPYPEQEESRRRKRYAVLSALATLDYVPEDGEHIGVFRTGAAESAKLLPPVVPFEIFRKSDANAKSVDKILLLWLDENKFERDIDRRSGEVFDLVTKSDHNKNTGPITVNVIGPNKSGNLKVLLREAEDCDVSKKNGIDFFAFGATADPVQLGNAAGCTNGTAPQHLFRTIANDSFVSAQLVKELRLRQVDPQKDAVLLLSEWDSFYGQSFPSTFVTAYQEEARRIAKAKGDDAPKFGPVYFSTYMRGIDGVLPSESAEKPEPQKGPTKSEGIQLNNNIDQPAGNHQQDYLRRLVDRLRDKESQLRATSLNCPFRNDGFAAIGIVGSDVYDKLMVLQALRPYFPGKIFFTTDMDAAYFSPQELPYTRNLIVGSGFGLSLARELQRATPPFRDSYQSAVFFATKLAAFAWNPGNNQWQPNTSGLHDYFTRQTTKVAARIFEVSRKGAVDLSSTESSVNSGDCPPDNFGCQPIHPPPVPPKFAGESSVLVVLAIALALLLIYRMSWSSRAWLPMFSRLDGWIRKKRTHTGRMGVAIELASMGVFVLIAALLCAAVAAYIFLWGKDEPFALWAGISIWPSNLLQLLAVILAVWLLRRMRRQSNDIEREIEKEFLHHAGKGAPHDATATPLGVRFPLAIHHWHSVTPANSLLDMTRLWDEFKFFGAAKHRLTRTITATLIFVLFGVCAVMLSGGQPVPSRGVVAFYTDALLEMACVLVTTFLIMWVVDSERLVSRLIDHIAQPQQSNWPALHQRKWGWAKMPDRYLAYWLDVEFVARYTKAMGRFIWYPVPSLVLLGAARSQVFDNWTFSPGLLAAVAILLTYLFSIAFLLQHSARVLRTKALAQLRADLREWQGAEIRDAELIAELEKMIASIESNSEGAFTPFLHQPLVHALLTLLSGSSGVLVLMDRLL